MSKCPYKNFKSKILKYVNILKQPRKEYSNMPACPFVGSEIDNDKMMISLFDPSKLSIIEMIEKFVNSKYDSAVFVQVDNKEISCEMTCQYQSFINNLLKEEGYDYLKCICVNPNDKVNIDGFNIRSHAPYFLITITNRKTISNAHKKLLKTKYFDKMDKVYLDYLKVKESDIRSKNGKK